MASIKIELRPLVLVHHQIHRRVKTLKTLVRLEGMTLARVNQVKNIKNVMDKVCLKN
jgi:hypothetical protein